MSPYPDTSFSRGADKPPADDIVCETPRLILRKLNSRDFDALTQVLGDPEVMKFSIFGAEDWDGILGFLKATQRRYERDSVGQWAVVLKETGDFVGVCGICAQILDGVKEHELGYRLARRFWGRGIATEAAAACRDYGFDLKGLPRLISIIASANRASIRVAEKLGMRREKESVYYGIPALIFSLEKSVRGRGFRPGEC